MTERQGAAHRITSTLPGAVPHPGVRKTKTLPSAIKRNRIPSDSQVQEMEREDYRRHTAAVRRQGGG
jgi:hypothetical protein